MYLTYFDLAELIFSSSLLGLILIIQFVHYPSFSYIDERLFRKFCEFHQRSITPIVAILMLVEATLSCLRLIQVSNMFTIANFLCVLLIWLTTFLVSVPSHKRLLISKNKLEIKFLVRTNMIRTILWGCKLFILLMITKSNNEGL